MRMLKTLVILSVLSASSVSMAARTVKLEPGDLQGYAEVFWSGGTPIVLSDVPTDDGEWTRIAISPANAIYDRNQRVSFYLTVINPTSDRIEVGIANVAAINDAGEALEIVDADTARQEIRGDARRRSFLASLAAGLRAYGQSYSAAASGATQFEADQVNRNEQILARIQQGEIQRGAEESLELTDLYFGRTTIFPGGSYTGFLDVHPPNSRGRADRIVIGVNVSGNLHMVEFNYVEVD